MRQTQNQPPRDYIAELNAQILQMLKEGTAPWKKPWVSMTFCNGKTGRAYTGSNPLICALASMIHGYADPRFLTFGQAKAIGAYPRKGSKAVTLLRPVTIVKKEDETDPEKVTFFLRRFVGMPVFNVEVLENLDMDKLKSVIGGNVTGTVPDVMSAMPNPPVVKYGAGAAGYYSKRDLVIMPDPKTFTDPASVALTLAHELAHSTGHESRLARKSVLESDHFGGMNYSFEELVAELTACYVCSYLGIMPDVTPSAEYLSGWVQQLERKESKQWIVQASSLAYKAFVYILNLEPEEDEDTKDEADSSAGAVPA
jgi:antirestriction protein ArdC